MKTCEAGRFGRRTMFVVIAILLGILVPLGVLEGTLRFLPVSTATGTMIVDDLNPIIRYAPNQEYTYAKGWRFAIQNKGRINNYGFVNNQDYSRDIREPLVVVGDSYVEAMMVPYESTVQGRLADTLGDRRQVYSIGISGAQLAQYLVFAQYASKNFIPTRWSSSSSGTILMRV